MTYEKDPFGLDEIPEFALQPAKEADEYNFHFMPRGATNRFDAAAYEKVLYENAKRAAEYEMEQAFPTESKEESSDFMEESAFQNQSELLEEATPVAFETQSELLEEVTPVAFQTQPELSEESIPVVFEDEEEVIPVAFADTEEASPLALDEMEVGAVLEPSFDQEESTPVSVHNPVTLPVSQPVSIPKSIPMKLIPMVGSLMSSKLKLVDIKQKPQLRISIEEDILVPDVKPDLARIIAMDGKIKLSEKEIHIGQSESDTLKVSGDLILHTLYVPEHMVDGEPMVAIESRLPFKNETDMKTGPYSDLTITPTIESIDFTVVNERKFKIRATAVFGIREYSNIDIEVFEGIRDEEVQMLKEKINLTDVALRKTETVEIKEELTLKENLPEIQKILKYDVNVVENHKQVTKEKAVINASVYCNIMYLGADRNADAVQVEEGEVASGGEQVMPVLYQGKTEFTQFIRLDGDHSPAEQNPAGSKVNFNISSLNLTAKEDGNGKRNIVELDMNVDTGLELYKNIEKEVVTDVYHHLKDIQYETDEIGIMSLGGSGVAEISVREIVNVPERYGNVDKIAYISGNISEKKSFIEQGKNIIEGIVTINLICTSADERKTAFNISQEVPFRSAMEIPGITSEMSASNDITLKELWSDKINNRQIEVNAGILVNTAISSQEKHQLVKNVSFLEGSQDSHPSPGIILYITRAGDTIWKIAKKYRTTIDEVKKMNELEYGKEIKPGTKLLIVAKNH